MLNNMFKSGIFLTMEIQRSKLKLKLRAVCQEAKKGPVFITHYGDVTEVIISKDLFDEMEEKARKYEKNKTK